MNIYVRLSMLTLPLFAGFSIALGLMFGAMFEAEFNRAFYEKWKVLTVTVHAARTEGAGSAEIDNFLTDKGRNGLLRGFSIVDNSADEIIYEWKHESETVSMTHKLKALKASGRINTNEASFIEGEGYVVYVPVGQGISYMLAAGDGERSSYMSGYHFILMMTAAGSLVAGFIVPLIFTLVLNSQIRKIDGREDPLAIRELDDLNHTFRIMKESLNDLKERDAGMLRSGLLLKSRFIHGGAEGK